MAKRDLRRIGPPAPAGQPTRQPLGLGYTNESALSSHAVHITCSWVLSPSLTQPSCSLSRYLPQATRRHSESRRAATCAMRATRPVSSSRREPIHRKCTPFLHISGLSEALRCCFIWTMFRDDAFDSVAGAGGAQRRCAAAAAAQETTWRGPIFVTDMLQERIGDK